MSLVCVLAALPGAALAAPYAAMVMDARSGEVLHAQNADTRLHPASLTKMMTLYIAFEAIRNGEITLDTQVRISQKAANEPPSKLGLRAGQTIALRYLIRAAAIRSANDAATAIGEAISGSEAAFAERMTRTARALGMNSTTFRNAHGLTASGHLSTARDMTIMGRRLFYDYPQYYNIFSRRSADAGIATVQSTNARFLDSYRGADGIKTGFTRAAGFNLVASAERGNTRVIATVFGGTSTAQRNQRVAELLDLGFRNAPAQVAVNRPALPSYTAPAASGTAAVVTAVARSPRPATRPVAAPPAELLVAMRDDISSVLAEVAVVEEGAGIEPPPAPPQRPEALASAETVAESVAEAVATDMAAIIDLPSESEEAPFEVAAAAPAAAATIPYVAPRPRPAAAAPTQMVSPATQVVERPQEVLAEATPAVATDQEVVTRVSTSGGRHWGINIGRYNSRNDAERVLLTTALAEPNALEGSLRRVNQMSGGFDATFMGLSQEQADLACRRLQARNQLCFTIGQ
ncbi:D-alanyl-D-alanine carboxypeptidase family protein [Halodurantibacterium flavum]|uniref:D-alanyl-D-alanine carboxypeptidase family protein n=1 Tax=Halodurantibacterium flavum TaxID=1382802 RepID=A0ABW4S9Q1_9RHOB